MERLTHKPPLEQQPHHLPSLRDVTRQEPTEVSGSLLDIGHDSVGVESRSLVECFQLCRERVTSGQLFAEASADRLGGRVCVAIH